MLELNDFEKSLKDFYNALYTESLFKDGIYVQSAYVNIGLVYIKQNKKDAACQSFSKAGELGSDEAYAVLLSIVTKWLI